ncbi:MAG: tyrosine-protein phosphatase [Vicinamibacterales bacterium]
MVGRPLFRFLLCAICLLRPAAAVHANPLPSTDALARFRQVDAALYRGAQPTAEQFEALAKLGIRTVVNLRRDGDEQRLVESLGMQYVDLSASLHPFGFGGGLEARIVDRFFQIIDDPASGPVFVHCRRGADRTGTLVAMYRIARQGWTVADAYDEARALGMRWWHYSVKKELRKFSARLESAASPADLLTVPTSRSGSEVDTPESDLRVTPGAADPRLALRSRW